MASRWIVALAACGSLAVAGLAEEIPLPEHPRPDWERTEWVNLNGSWRFAFDAKDEGIGNAWFAAADDRFDKSILVPFPWGSKLSGVKDEADIGWYRREITVPAEWKGKRVFLVIGASDHDTAGWLDGQKLGAHSGGYTPFEFELTDVVKWGEPQKLTLRAWDEGNEPARKSWRLYGKQGYGNARGIWQTVYLEARGQEYLETVHFTPDIENGAVHATITLGAPAKKTLEFELAFNESDRAKPALATFPPGKQSVKVKIPLRDVKLWDLANPYLYEVRATLKGESGEDSVSTYFGMRKVGVGKMPGSDFPYVTLNGKPIYLQLTLDPTRLVEDNSPCNRDHVITDINTWHGYRPGYAWEDTVEQYCTNTYPGSVDNYIGGFVQGNEPMFNSECGNVWGYKGSTGDCDWSWDYHMMINAFRRRLKCGGWLYTEHHDVINEWNGYVRFDRSQKFTGIEELFPGSSLKDWHADAYLPLDAELCREFEGGETWTMPVDLSLVTDRYSGKRLSLSYQVRYWNAAGRLVEGESVEVDSYKVASWQYGRLADVPVALPNETACGTICFTLKGDEDVVARNFACFVTRGMKPSNAISVAPAAFARAEWSQKQWNVLDGLKVNGAGKGFFEYVFSGVPAGRDVIFRAEVSAKRLNAKDSKDLGDGARDLDYMLGGGFADRSKNANSYPMTSTEKWAGAVKVYANDVLVKMVELPDDPADHRGVLSWLAQPRDRTLHEAGSYGYLVEAAIPTDALALCEDGKLKIRLESEGRGLAIYGAKFGRYPLDPTVSF